MLFGKAKRAVSSIDDAKTVLTRKLGKMGFGEGKIEFTRISGPHPPVETFTRRTRRKGNFYNVTVYLPIRERRRRHVFYVFENGDVIGRRPRT